MSDGVTSIGNNAFAACGSLQYITFPKTVTTVGTKLVTDLTSLLAVRYIGTEDEWNASDFKTQEFSELPAWSAVWRKRSPFQKKNIIFQNGVLSYSLRRKGNSGDHCKIRKITAKCKVKVKWCNLICRYRIPFWKISDSSCVVPDAAGISQGDFLQQPEQEKRRKIW